MCVVIDADKLAELGDVAISKDGGMHLVHQWIKRRGKVIYSAEGKYACEMRDVPGKSGEKMREMFKRYFQAGRAERIGKKECDSADKSLPADADLESNRPGKGSDRHILALAKAGGATLLCTGDKGLMSDFTDHVPRGKVFPRGFKRQQDFLKQHSCP